MVPGTGSGGGAAEMWSRSVSSSYCRRRERARRTWWRAAGMEGEWGSRARRERRWESAERLARERGRRTGSGGSEGRVAGAGAEGLAREGGRAEEGGVRKPRKRRPAEWMRSWIKPELDVT